MTDVETKEPAGSKYPVDNIVPKPDQTEIDAGFTKLRPGNGLPAGDVSKQAKPDNLLQIGGRSVEVRVLTVGDQMRIMGKYSTSEERAAMLIELASLACYIEGTETLAWPTPDDLSKARLSMGTTLRLMRMVQEVNPVEDDPSP